MSAQSNPTGKVVFTTVSIENSETVELDLFVSLPDQAELFIKTLAPGEIVVQLSPVGAVWSLRPRVAEKRFTVRDGGNTFRSTETSRPDGSPRSTRKERGGASITSTTAPPEENKKP